MLQPPTDNSVRYCITIFVACVMILVDSDKQDRHAMFCAFVRALVQTLC